MFSSSLLQLHCKAFAKMGDDKPFVCSAPGCGQVSWLSLCLGFQVWVCMAGLELILLWLLKSLHSCMVAARLPGVCVCVDVCGGMCASCAALQTCCFCHTAALGYTDGADSTLVKLR